MIADAVGPRIVAGAELEDVSERGDEEEQQLEEELLRGADAKQKRNHKQKLHFDQLDDQEKRQEGGQQSVLYEFSWKRISRCSHSDST